MSNTATIFDMPTMLMSLVKEADDTDRRVAGALNTELMHFMSEVLPMASRGYVETYFCIHPNMADDFAKLLTTSFGFTVTKEMPHLLKVSWFRN